MLSDTTHWLSKPTGPESGSWGQGSAGTKAFAETEEWRQGEEEREILRCLCLTLWKSCDEMVLQIPLVGLPQSPPLPEIFPSTPGPQTWLSKKDAAKSCRAPKTHECRQKSIPRETTKSHTLSGPATGAGNFTPRSNRKPLFSKQRKRGWQTEINRHRSQPSSSALSPRPRKLQVEDQVLLTSWQGGSGRLEAEGRSPAQAAWQPASAQQQIQAGLQGGERPRRGASAGRPRPLPRTGPRERNSIFVPPRSAGRRQGSLPGVQRQLRLPGRDCCALGSPLPRPLPVRPLTAPLRSRPGQPAPVLPSRRREGPPGAGAGAARGRDAGRGRGSWGAGGADRGCGPARRVPRGCAALASR